MRWYQDAWTDAPMEQRAEDLQVEGSVVDPGEGDLLLLALLLAHEGAVCQAPDARRQLAHILLRLLGF